MAMLRCRRHNEVVVCADDTLGGHIKSQLCTVGREYKRPQLGSPDLLSFNRFQTHIVESGRSSLQTEGHADLLVIGRKCDLLLLLVCGKSARSNLCSQRQ